LIIKKTILFIFFSKIIINLIFKYFSFNGDNSPESLDLIYKYFSKEDLQIGEEYSKKGFEISIISMFIDSIFLFLFIFKGYSSKLEEFASKICKNNYFLTSLIFISFLYTLDFALELPFSFYFDFYLEKQFGFSNMTIGSWLFFTLKNFLLGFISILFVGIGFLYILKIFKKSWIILVPISSILIGLTVSILFPIYITPLYYETYEISEGSLKIKILDLCKKENINLSNIFIIKESEYSNHTNAYFTGWGNERKIFLYDTLVNNHSEDEIVSVLGHEIGHWKNNHQIKDIIYSSILLFFGCFFINKLFYFTKIENGLFLNEIYNPSSLPFIILIFGILNFLVMPIENSLSRHDETEADLEALILTKDVDSFISTEIKMAKDNKSRLNPHPVIVLFYYSHPKTIDRIQLAEDFRKK
jgi:STE24 endopeptidase